jgi:hypothetical protein
MMMRDARARSAALRLPLGLCDGSPSLRVAGTVSALLVASAVTVAVVSWAAWVRAPLALALVVLASLVQRAASRGRRPRHGWLIVDDQGVRRVGAARESMVLDWREPFGATVLASPDRATLTLALTMPRAVRYVSARVTDAEDAASAPKLIARATTAAESDLRFGDQATLTAADAERLLSEIARRVPIALERVFLSDAGGEPVVLEPSELRVGSRSINLCAPLEWRASVFHERGIHAATVSQATWVRQAGVEVVLVAAAAADGAWSRDVHPAVRAAGEGRIVERAIARDLRLMQAMVGDPPPRELRRAIDRLFMLPLRHALDRAPRAPVDVEPVRVRRRPLANP